MFDAIAPRYDLLNHLLSAGLDRGWRDRAVESLALTEHARVLDLCTGTGDLAIATVHRVKTATVVGVDFAGEMLRLGLEKVRRAALHRQIQLIRGDAARIPLPDGSCDAATIGFGIRNVAQPERALAEIARVVKPVGDSAILEFGQPSIRGNSNALLLVFSLPASAGRPAGVEAPERIFLPSRLGGRFPPPLNSAESFLPRVFHRFELSHSALASSICLLPKEPERALHGSARFYRVLLVSWN
jgi:ubiquinone/menaquinone biosynthesis methyltransferase